MVTLAERARRLEAIATNIELASEDCGTAIHPFTGEPDARNLTRRHRQVLDHLKTGLSEKEVSHELSISPHTVHVYVKAIYKKLKVTSRGELLSLWVNGRLFNTGRGRRSVHISLDDSARRDSRTRRAASLVLKR
jgi:DNA-binding NarL/FixJ family response regulator